MEQWIGLRLFSEGWRWVSPSDRSAREALVLVRISKIGPRNPIGITAPGRDCVASLSLAVLAALY